MIREELTVVLLEILENNFRFEPNMLQEEYWNIPLTGNRFRLSGFDLAALILEFEKRTGIKVDINSEPMYASGSIEGIVESAYLSQKGGKDNEIP